MIPQLRSPQEAEERAPRNSADASGVQIKSLVSDVEEYCSAEVTESWLRKKIKYVGEGIEEKKSGGQPLFRKEENILLKERIELVRSKMLVVKKADIILDAQRIVKEREKKTFICGLRNVTGESGEGSG